MSKVSPLVISSITLYPVKALGGVPVREAVVESRGFRGDRRFMVVDDSGRFLTQRECRAMARVGARWNDGDLVLETEQVGTFVLPAGPVGPPGLSVRIWDDTVLATAVSAAADEWLSEALAQPVRLVAMPESTVRSVNSAFDRGGDIVSFADGYPYLVISDASLSDLNARLAAPVEMGRFRPNFTVSGADPYEEDHWRAFDVGSVGFAGVKRCARCVVTTIEPGTGHAGHEPLQTLATYRKTSGQVMFGMNVVPDVDEGSPEAARTVRVGDPVRVQEPI